MEKDIDDVIKVLSGTKSGKMIFHDCFIPVAVQADKAKIQEWIDLDGLPEEYKEVLKGYLEGAEKHNGTHQIGGQ